MKWRIGLAIGGLLMLALMVLAVIAEPIWGAAAETTTLDSHLPASAEHWFGTDALGRDVFARTMVATRLTLLMSFGAAGIASVAGIAIGSLIWISGPRVREAGLRLIDVLVSYPSVIFALVVAAVLGPAPVTAVVAIGLATAPAFARLTANLVSSVATRDFIVTARLLGVSPLRLLRRHLLPNVAEPLLVLMSVAFTVSMKALTGLSFLGFGPQAPDYDWGSLLHHGLEGMYVNPAPALGPSLAIVIAGIAGGFLGDGLAAMANPRSTGRGSRAQIKAALTAPALTAPALTAPGLAAAPLTPVSPISDISEVDAADAGAATNGVAAPTLAAAAGVTIGSIAASGIDTASKLRSVEVAGGGAPGQRASVDDAAAVDGDGVSVLRAAVDGMSRLRVGAGVMSARQRGDALVVAEGLTVCRGDGVVLVDGVSFAIGKGEIVGVVGESGSGKSLTAMALARLLPDGLTVGARELTVAGRDVLRDNDKKHLATEIGIVYQDPQTSFNPALRVGTQITEALRLHGGVSRKDANRRAIEQLELAKVTMPAQRMKQRPHELSGGMRQRAMIASALLTSPKLLIADEPTTALDVTVQAEVLGLLREANLRGTSILFISHDIAVVASLCHRILVMHQGQIVEELTNDELLGGRAQHPYTQKLLSATLTVGVPSA